MTPEAGDVWPRPLAGAVRWKRLAGLPLQGGLLLSQVQRSSEPLEVALDTVIDYVSSLTVPVPS